MIVMEEKRMEEDFEIQPNLQIEERNLKNLKKLASSKKKMKT